MEDISTQFLVDLGSTIGKFPNAEWGDALSSGQLVSKLWLIDIITQVCHSIGTVYVVGGWYGILPRLMFDSVLDVEKIRSFDIDVEANEIADKLNNYYVNDAWKFKSVSDNMYNINYKEHVWQTWSKSNNRLCNPFTEKPDTVINTSCEHVDAAAWAEMIPAGTLVVAQSNDFITGKGHINCVSCEEALAEQLNLTNIMYKGSKKFDKYTRYMVVGRK